MLIKRGENTNPASQSLLGSRSANVVDTRTQLTTARQELKRSQTSNPLAKAPSNFGWGRNPVESPTGLNTERARSQQVRRQRTMLR